jgi:hypothetical protein
VWRHAITKNVCKTDARNDVQGRQQETALSRVNHAIDAGWLIVYPVPGNVQSCVAQRLARLAPIDGNDRVIAGKIHSERRTKKTCCPGYNNDSLICRGHCQEIIPLR